MMSPRDSIMSARINNARIGNHRKISSPLISQMKSQASNQDDDEPEFDSHQIVPHDHTKDPFHQHVDGHAHANIDITRKKLKNNTSEIQIMKQYQESFKFNQFQRLIKL